MHVVHFTQQCVTSSSSSTNAQNATICHHCGDPCASGSIRQGDLQFCCTGCLSVYTILRDAGMCSYYELGSEHGTSQRNVSSDTSRFEVLDDPSTASRFIVAEMPGMVVARFTLPTMHCASCIWLLERLSRFEPGITSSRVDLLRKSIEIQYNPASTSLRKVANVVSSVGYPPLLTSEEDVAQRQSEQREALRGIYLRMGVAGFAAGNVMMMSVAQYLSGGTLDSTLITVFSVISVLISIPVYFFSASSWLRSAMASIRRGVINLDVPVALGITTVFVRSLVDIIGGYGEGFLDSFTGLVLFLLVGRLFQQKAFDAVTFDRTVRSFFPLSVRRCTRGEESVVPVDAVRSGDELFVRYGEVVPADSVVLSEIGYVDYSFVTGESVPVECTKGTLIYAGGRVVGHALRLTATRPASQSYLASLWERTSGTTTRNAYSTRSNTFGLVFTLGTVAIALVAAVYHGVYDMRLAANVFTAVLIIACPCAFTLAAPITLGTAMGALSRVGLYIKNIGVMVELRRVRSVVFDKTGTLTDRTQARYHGRELSATESAAVQALVSQSTHPVSRAIAAANTEYADVDAIEEEIGKGLCGSSLGYTITIGSAEYAKKYGTNVPSTGDTVLVIDGEFVGTYEYVSRMRDGVEQSIAALSTMGYQTQLLTGDGDKDLPLLKRVFPASRMRFKATPEEKVFHIQQLRNEAPVLMVGDGLNDMSAMAAADVSIAVTEDSSTLAPASDMIMPANSIQRLPALLTYAHNCSRVIQAALWFTMVYNVFAIGLAVMGLLTPVVTAIMMPVSSLMVVGMSVGGARFYARRMSWR